MMAYIVEMISIEKVVSSVKRFSNFSASKDLPFDLEDAMVFWINKVKTRRGCQGLAFGPSSTCAEPRYLLSLQVNIKMREIVEKELKMKQHLLESPSHQKVTACVSLSLTASERKASSLFNSVFLG